MELVTRRLLLLFGLVWGFCLFAFSFFPEQLKGQNCFPDGRLWIETVQGGILKFAFSDLSLTPK